MARPRRRALAHLLTQVWRIVMFLESNFYAREGLFQATAFVQGDAANLTASLQPPQHIHTQLLLYRDELSTTRNTNQIHQQLHLGSHARVFR
eukprot:scaffold45699_cov75-Phaeocystis_antarctica.AAC.5